MKYRLFMSVEATAFAGLIFLRQAMPSEAVILAFFAFATIVFQGWQTRKMNQSATKVDKVAEQVGEVHTIVNSQRTEMTEAIEALKAEVARLQAGGGNTPTTRQAAAPPPVTIRDGHVTVPKPP